jgi:hypothetical protein
MKTLKVELHCHTSLSDGQLTPAELTALLSACQIRIASLTDHNTIEGQEEFQKTASDYNIRTITGVEMNAVCKNQDYHFLCYGFDRQNPEVLKIISQSYETMKKLESGGTGTFISFKKVQQVFHQAGGKVFLAHPMVYYNTDFQFESLIHQLCDEGLDGLECYSTGYNPLMIRYLSNLARTRDLLISGGSDFHSRTDTRITDPLNAALKISRELVPGVEMPVHDLQRLLKVIH